MKPSGVVFGLNVFALLSDSYKNFLLETIIYNELRYVNV